MKIHSLCACPPQKSDLHESVHVSVHNHLVSETKTSSSWHDDIWDRLGILVSGLCAIHCLITPFVIFSMPFLYMWLHHPLFHLAVAIFVGPLAVYAFTSGYKIHKNKTILRLASVGLGIILLGVFLPHTWTHRVGHDILTIAGSFLLIIAHYLNYRQIKNRCLSTHPGQ
ncbi:MAG: MerC domain-containing protein [Pseudobdellovibrionaceae bacterium]